MKSLLSLILLILFNIFCLAQDRLGKDRALFFAVNDYDQMTDLKNPIKNANDISLELKNNYGFEIEVVRNPSSVVVKSKLREYFTPV